MCRQKAVDKAGALRGVLQTRFKSAAAVSLQWIMFGTARQETRPQAGQLAGFDRCTGFLSKQMKCIGNVQWLQERTVFRPGHVHQCTFKYGSPFVLFRFLCMPHQAWDAEAIINCDLICLQGIFVHMHWLLRPAASQRCTFTQLIC